MIKQSEAVVNAVQDTLGDNFVTHETVAKDVLTNDQLTSIVDTITQGIMDGEIAYGKNLDEKDVKKYVSSMVNNHLRKSKKLNGGTTHKPTKEGTKRDEQLKALNQLLKTSSYEEGSEEHNAILKSIQERKQELAEKRASTRVVSKHVSVDVSSLPDDLKHLAE